MIEVIQGNSENVNVKPYLLSRGWEVIDGNRLKHSSENNGKVIFNNYKVTSNTKYIISFTITNRTSGSVKVSIGGDVERTVSTNGYHQFTFTTVNSESLYLYSDGDLTISNMGITRSVQEQVDGDNTIAYSEPRGGWISFRSYNPESANSMYTDLFTFKEGELWVHDDVSVPNNIYGTQFDSKVKFPVSSVGVKSYQSIAVHSNKILGTTEDGIQTELGDITDLVEFDFTTKEGIHYANLLRDKLTNNIPQGRYIIVELTDEENPDTKLQLFKVVLKSNISTPNE